jgi:hypothetical protein
MNCQPSYRLKGSTEPADTVFYSRTVGIAGILAYGEIHTPEGIKVGSTLAEVQRAYPDWKPVRLGYDGPEGTGRGEVTVPGNSDARYRLSVSAEGKVDQLGLVVPAPKWDCGN